MGYRRTEFNIVRRTWPFCFCNLRLFAVFRRKNVTLTFSYRQRTEATDRSSDRGMMVGRVVRTSGWGRMRKHPLATAVCPYNQRWILCARTWCDFICSFIRHCLRLSPFDRPSGHIYSKEFILEYLLTKKKDLKRQRAQYDAEQVHHVIRMRLEPSYNNFTRLKRLKRKRTRTRSEKQRRLKNFSIIRHFSVVRIVCFRTMRLVTRITFNYHPWT